MPRIIRAEFLSYYNPRRNSDKLFNIFLIEDDDRTFRCVSEYGRRGRSLVRDTLCAKASREFAESQLRHKLFAKRDHRETPYSDYALGQNYSQISQEYGYDGQGLENNKSSDSSQVNQSTPNRKSIEPKSNVITFPVEKKENGRNEPKCTGILNQGQFDSLEI